MLGLEDSGSDVMEPVGCLTGGVRTVYLFEHGIFGVDTERGIQERWVHECHLSVV